MRLRLVPEYHSDSPPEQAHLFAPHTTLDRSAAGGRFGKLKERDAGAEDSRAFFRPLKKV